MGSQVTVVVPVKNRRDLTENLLECLRWAGGYDEILIFDNGSTDGTQEYLEAQSDVTWFSRPEKNIYALWNEGLDRSPGHTAILNNDISFEAGFLQAMVRVLGAGVGAACPTPWTRSLQDHPIFAPDLVGWAFMLPAETPFRFDEGFCWWYGDTDMAQQIRAAGLKIAYGKTRCKHIGGASQGPAWRERVSDHRRYFERWPDEQYEKHMEGVFARSGIRVR